MKGETAMSNRLNRRELLGGAAALAPAALIANGASTQAAEPKKDALARRTLGRTGFKTTILGIGMAPIGMGGHSLAEAERLVNEVLDLGVNYVDVAPNYANAEEKLGPVMARRRDEVFLVTKVEEQKKEGILRQIQNSLRLMKTDHVDAVHLHNLGDFDLKEVFESDTGGLAGLEEAKKRGYLRYFGVSGHIRPWKFTEAINTGKIDLVMPAMNFVDRHTYNFEEKVLPAARKHKTAVVAMKVLGGAVKMVYEKPTPAMLTDHYEDAVRYALGLEGVSAVILGLRNSEEIKKAVATVKAFEPLPPARLEALMTRGKEMAAMREWGPHFGPVV
jgi:aryl-alcohol dehydrogenase-like predicted oxidoreductase